MRPAVRPTSSRSSGSSRLTSNGSVVTTRLPGLSPGVLSLCPHHSVGNFLHPKHEGLRPNGRSPSSWSTSDGANVLRLGTLGTLGDVELDLLVLVEGLVALRLDGGVVDENVVATVLLRDEAETLFGVEPLDSALSHARISPYWRETTTSAASTQMR